MPDMFRLAVKDLARRFGPREVFSRISFELSTGQSLAVTGPNGSGKTTLLMILLGLLRPTDGSAEFFVDGARLSESNLRARVAFVAPYLNLYDQLTAEENLKFLTSVAGDAITGKAIDNSLARVGLQGRGHDRVGEYSSGMKQRLKYALALLGNPDFLLLDEPTSGMDDDGKRLVSEIIEEHRDHSVVVIATNEEQERSLAHEQCRLD